MESSKYGWFWECPNGGKKCHYRHALPPGTALSPGSLWEENWIIWRRDPIFRLSKTRYNTASSLTGFVLKKDQKKEDKGSTITIEELIEKEVITFLWSIFLLFSNIYWCLFFFIQLGKQIHVPKATYMKGWVIYDDDDDDDDFINAFLNKMFFTILN